MIEELLLEQIQVIQKIDGGCSYCISDFIDKYNIVILKYGYKYIYENEIIKLEKI